MTMITEVEGTNDAMMTGEDGNDGWRWWLVIMLVMKIDDDDDDDDEDDDDD